MVITKSNVHVHCWTQFNGKIIELIEWYWSLDSNFFAPVLLEKSFHTSEPHFSPQ